MQDQQRSYTPWGTRPLDQRFIDDILAAASKSTNERVVRFWKRLLRTYDGSTKLALDIAGIIASRFINGVLDETSWQITDPMIWDVIRDYDPTVIARVEEEEVESEEEGDLEEEGSEQGEHGSEQEDKERGEDAYAEQETGSEGEMDAGKTAQSPVRLHSRSAEPQQAKSRTQSERHAPHNEPSHTFPERHYDSDLDIASDWDVDDLPPQQPEDVGQLPPLRIYSDKNGRMPPPPRADPQDMAYTHVWRNQLQPPVGVRAHQMLNWVQDEDIYRRPDFAREAEEVEAWVDEHLAKRYQTDGGLGPGTVAVLREIKRALRVHKLFDDYHKKTRLLPLKVFDPKYQPKFKERLAYREEYPIQLCFSTPKSRRGNLMPLLQTERDFPTKVVNGMWRKSGGDDVDETKRLNQLRGLATDEDKFWLAPPDAISAAKGRMAAREDSFNMFVSENWHYENCIAQDGVGLKGWVSHTDGSKKLWNGKVLLSNDRSGRAFAAERGSRRAGFQAALRQLDNFENRLVAQQTGRMLILPVDPPDLDQVTKDAGIGNGAPLPLVKLPATQMGMTDGKMDPQGFISNMNQFWARHRTHMEAARSAILNKYGGRGPHASPVSNTAINNKERTPQTANSTLLLQPFVLPPHSLWVPFVWRGVSAEKQIHQDMLRKLRSLKELFDRERRIASRPLLTDMEYYYQQGLRSSSTSLRDPLVRANLHPVRDFEPVGGSGETGNQVTSPRRQALHNQMQNQIQTKSTVRLLDEIEMEWLRFLFNHAFNSEMIHDLEPRTALFITFAERLARIFDDPSDNLFPDNKTWVGIETLIDHMTKLGGGMEGEGLITKTKFYPYDAKRFLERLASQGRCKYQEDWHSYGLVARPESTLFPEQLILWRERNDTEVLFDKYPEDMVFAPRFSDCRTWEDVVMIDEEYGNGEHEPLDENVIQYFHCLAYRWGYSIRHLQAEERNQWSPLPSGRRPQQQQQQQVSTPTMENMNAVLTAFEIELSHQTGGKDFTEHSKTSPLIDVWRATLKVDETSASTTQSTALAAIRRGIIEECVKNNTMLFPGRTTDYTNPEAAKVREKLWDWATPEVRGHVKKRFFSLDRWPVQLQTTEKQRRIVGDDAAEVDLQQLWDPVLEDPTPWSYYRPKARSYGENRKEIKYGYRMFPIGDTPRKRKAVIDDIMVKAAEAMGWQPGNMPHGDSQQQPHQQRPRSGILQRLTTFLGLKRPRPDEDDDIDSDEDGAFRHKLPRIDPALIPKSVDPPHVVAANNQHRRETMDTETESRGP